MLKDVEESSFAQSFMRSGGIEPMRKQNQVVFL